MRTVYSVAPNLAVPEGRIRFCRLTALTTSAGDRPRACSACMSRSTEISRFLPPYGNGMATPGIVTSCGRSVLTAASNTVCSGRVGLDRPSWITGMLDAEYLITSGGVIPGGSWRSCACSIATTWAIAVWMLAVGWKKTLMIGDAGERGRLDVLDVAHRRRQAALVLGRDPLAHLLRRQAVVVPDDRDHRDVDLREDVGRHVEQRERRRQDDQHRHHDERVRALERQLDHGHRNRAPGCGKTTMIFRVDASRRRCLTGASRLVPHTARSS